MLMEGMSHIVDPDLKVVCFRDADIYGRDLTLLLPSASNPNGDWLNGSCINFWLRVLEDRLEAAFAGTDAIFFVDPAVMSFIRFHCDNEDLQEFRENVNLTAHELILCPVNNSEDGVHVGAGTHWSMLAYWRGRSEFQHFDSAGTSNYAAAKATASVLSKAMHIDSSGGGLPLHLSRWSDVIVHNMGIPRQTNGVDCGVFCLCVAEAYLTAIIAVCRNGEPAAGVHQSSTATATETPGSSQ
mmetsp:Transcript_22311/g.30452  ORF Transcript_22311/g.30452 Transcript_22311/m.30452 type:complete len:241 (-) Transcript_22311:397-1119(-)